MDCQATLSISVTQCDPTSATTPLHWPAPATVHVSCPAKQLAPQQRRDLAIQVLAGTETVSELAREHEVSRKFLYQTGPHRQTGLDSAFAPVLRSEEVLFYLPVTKSWLRQLVLALVFICQSSTRGVVELLRDVFDFRISLGTVHNIVHSPVAQARRINQQYDLSTIVIGLLDEIFQWRRSRLVGVDAQSTFCFLLSPEEHRDADTWGVRLLELVDQGFAPKATIADFGSGLRALGIKRCCLRSPAAVMFFMHCTTLGRWSVTWRTGLTKPSTHGPSSSESKPPPSGGMAGRTRVWPRSYRTHGRPRPRR